MPLEPLINTLSQSTDTVRWDVTLMALAQAAVALSRVSTFAEARRATARQDYGWMNGALKTEERSSRVTFRAWRTR
jgi:hypothetical protein